MPISFGTGLIRAAVHVECMAQSQRTSGGKGGASSGFDPLGLLRSTLSDALSTLSTGVDEQSRPVEADDAEADTERPAEEAVDEESVPQVDFTEMEPEEALYALLCREDGKMKQSAMVTETGWSKSKVSRRLGNLEEAERIGRVRQGREKVVFVKPGTQRTEAVA